jgi:two-component system, chemotaxis family, chemotaxis protein CheY
MAESRQRTALVVDDSVTIRQVVSFTLKQAGFGVVAAVDGQDALERLDSHRVDLIITDLNMPRLDGIALIRRLRARPASKFTPVLMLTTESQESKRQEGRAAGATGWIVKPFHPDRLLQVIAKVLR